MTPVSVLLAFACPLVPLAMLWLDRSQRFGTPGPILILSMLCLPLAWCFSVGMAMARAGWKRTWWLLLMMPVAMAWPIGVIVLLASCIIYRSCL